MRPNSNDKKSSIVLVCDSDTDFRKLLQTLSEGGHTVVRTEMTGKPPVAIAEPDLVIWHHPGSESLPQNDLKRLRAGYSCTELLVLTDSDSLEDVLKTQDISLATTTAERTHLLNTVNRAIRYGQLKRDLENLRSQVAMSFGFDNLIGVSEPVMALKETIARVAPTDITIAITGPGGAGKRLIAKTIHHHSNRRFAALVSVDCAALTEATVETELFGSGTVASALKRADGGTLLINEINFMPQPVQLRLAEFLKDYRLPQPDGSAGEKTDLRLIVTGDDDLESMVGKGALRTELFQHLSVYPVVVPALRERTEDIENLLDYFLRRIATRLNCGSLAVTHQALQKLYTHSWPGNIRELENTLQRAAGLCRDGQIDEADLRFVGIIGTDNDSTEPLRKMTLKGHQGLLADSQKTIIVKALEENDWNFTQTAQKLGIGRTTLWRKVKKYDLARETVES
jgi:DNA-binding NtrC family response regulator